MCSILDYFFVLAVPLLILGVITFGATVRAFFHGRFGRPSPRAILLVTQILADFTQIVVLAGASYL